MFALNFGFKDYFWAEKETFQWKHSYGSHCIYCILDVIRTHSKLGPSLQWQHTLQTGTITSMATYTADGDHHFNGNRHCRRGPSLQWQHTLQTNQQFHFL